MTLSHTLVTGTVRGLIRILCRVDDRQLARVPARGPLLLIANHVNFLDGPVYYTHLTPRPFTGFAKVETWDNPIFRLLANLWGAIPLRRGEADMTALRQGLQALQEGRILGVTPEGHRSGDGKLLHGHAGIVFLALHSGAPLLPVVCSGAERFWQNVRGLHRTDLHLVVGHPFYLEASGVKVSRQVRQQMADEVMYQMAALLPPASRGTYADLSLATEEFVRFPEGAVSNLGPVHSTA